MSELVCARCGEEILPGMQVDYVYGGDDPEPRIVMSDELILVHERCGRGE